MWGVGSWASDPPFVCLSFLFCKMGMIILPTVSSESNSSLALYQLLLCLVLPWALV